MDYIEKIKECISDLEEEGMLGYIEKLLEVGEEPIEIVNRALIPGIENVGALYQEGGIFYSGTSLWTGNYESGNGYVTAIYF